MKILNKLELMSPSIKVGGSNGYSVELPENAGVLLTEESTTSLISTAKTEAINESKNYTDQKVSSVYRVKGTVPSVEDLPEDAEVGDVYNISDDLGGHNYVKTENGWDKLGGTVDLSPYALKTDVSGCVEALEGKITTAQNSAVSTSNAYTDACIVAANLSQYAKAEDVYTKTAADSTFVKVGDATTGNVDADKVEAENVEVSGCLVVSGDSIFSGCTTFCQVPNVDGDDLATVSYVSGCLDNLDYLSTHECIDCVLIVSDKPITFRQEVVFEGDTPVWISCSPVATKDYVDISSCSVKDYIDESLCNYLPVTPADSLGDNGLVAYCVTNNVDFLKGLYICGQNVATQDYVNSSICNLEYLPASSSCSSSGCIEYNISDNVNFTGDLNISWEGNDNCAWTFGVKEKYIRYTNTAQGICTQFYLCQALTISGAPWFFEPSVEFKQTPKIGVKPIATQEYADQAESDANKYTDDCVAAVEAKIPTDYLPATKNELDQYEVGSINFLNAQAGCICVETSLSYKGYEVATLNDIFPVIKCTNANIYSSSGCLSVCGIIASYACFSGTVEICGDPVATESYADQAESDAFCAAKAYTDEKIASLGSVLEYKGNKTYEELPTEGNEVGDVYNITADYAEEGIKAGDNVVWNGSDWDVLSGPIDLSGYYDKEEVDACVKTATDAVSALCSAVDTKLDSKADKSTTYTKTEVDTALDGYLTVDSSDGTLKVNDELVFTACGVRFSSDVYFDDHHVYLNVFETNSLSLVATEYYVDEKVNESSACIQESIDKAFEGVYTKTEVDAALEGYLPVESGCNDAYSYDSENKALRFYNGDAEVMRLCGAGRVVFPVLPESEQATPTSGTHLTTKSYVDNLVSTSISAANTNIVYDEDFVLGDGTFDASTSQMKWTVSPEGATKILSVIALDGEGNLVYPSYKWANNTLTVSIFAESEQDNPGYTVTVSYKK